MLNVSISINFDYTYTHSNYEFTFYPRYTLTDSSIPSAGNGAEFSSSSQY